MITDLRMLQEAGRENIARSMTTDDLQDMLPDFEQVAKLIGIRPEQARINRQIVEAELRRRSIAVNSIQVDFELAQDLYPVFVALIDWSVKAGRTEVNAVRAAAAALRAIGVSSKVSDVLRARYGKGTRYLARREL